MTFLSTRPRQFVQRVAPAVLWLQVDDAGAGGFVVGERNVQGVACGGGQCRTTNVAVATKKIITTISRAIMPIHCPRVGGFHSFMLFTPSK